MCVPRGRPRWRPNPWLQTFGACYRRHQEACVSKHLLRGSPCGCKTTCPAHHGTACA
ncbi:hypothetical protein BDA96_03G149500 [Sorghum bicolor]|uniref:Uncharacterized protein n=1 Tax=Sorghum bicolor TaxID=4558 RepID=A0A921RBN4_SORBI|nr:hypothetical protein BDA96_03G149500 [Sorghum bicolor]